MLYEERIQKSTINKETKLLYNEITISNSTMINYVDTMSKETYTMKLQNKDKSSKLQNKICYNT